MSTPRLLTWYTASNTEFRVGVMFVEEEVIIFFMSLTSATIQDGGSRERKD